uniref:Uncharacterized protein n=1 Tax=Arundo donax TaxID=35708 RepID=A0A0A9AJT8_ARUDO
MTLPLLKVGSSPLILLVLVNLFPFLASLFLSLEVVPGEEEVS